MVADMTVQWFILAASLCGISGYSYSPSANQYEYAVNRDYLIQQELKSQGKGDTLSKVSKKSHVLMVYLLSVSCMTMAYGQTIWAIWGVWARPTIISLASMANNFVFNAHCHLHNLM